MLVINKNISANFFITFTFWVFNGRKIIRLFLLNNVYSEKKSFLIDKTTKKDD